MNKTMKKIVTAAAVASVAFSAAAFAQSGMAGLANQVEQMKTNFAIADKNHDGYLTKAEADAGYTPYLASHFDAIDVRHEGKISQQDVATYWKASMHKANRSEEAAAPATAAS